MANPIISGASVRPFDPATSEEASAPAKAGESKFDKVRSRLLDDQASQVELPPEAKPVAGEQKNALQADLLQRLQSGGPISVHDLFAPHMKQASQGIEHLTQRVNALPQTPAFEPFRQRLASIDSQYQAAGKLVNSMPGSATPGDLMKIQMQMYQLTENLEMMSKVVEQVSSGVKSVLQTQV
jgi:hypothetical protein